MELSNNNISFKLVDCNTRNMRGHTTKFMLYEPITNISNIPMNECIEIYFQFINKIISDNFLGLTDKLYVNISNTKFQFNRPRLFKLIDLRDLKIAGPVTFLYGGNGGRRVLQKR